MKRKRATRKSKLVDQLVSKHFGSVRRVVCTMAVREDRLLSFDDHVAAGLVGLWHAAQRFDPAAGVKFDTFAEQHIRGAVLDNIRNVWRTKRAAAGREPYVMASLDAPADRRDGRVLTLGALVAAPRPSIGPGCQIDLADALRGLPDQQRLIIIRRYLEGHRCYDCLPGLSAARIWQVRKSALARLRRLLT